MKGAKVAKDGREPVAGETRKAWLHRVYGIGKGSGRGRISADGHVKLAWAKEQGYTFADTDAASAPKPASMPRATTVRVTPTAAQRDDASRVDPAAVRQWAVGNGYRVSKRGRISSEVILKYLDEVPEHERGGRASHGGELLEGAPRVHPEGTVWRADFVNYRGEKETATLSDRTACGNCRYSLGWCGCARPYVTVGYESGDVRLTAIYPKDR